MITSKEIEDWEVEHGECFIDDVIGDIETQEVVTEQSLRNLLKSDKRMLIKLNEESINYGDLDSISEYIHEDIYCEEHSDTFYECIARAINDFGYSEYIKKILENK